MNKRLLLSILALLLLSFLATNCTPSSGDKTSSSDTTSVTQPSFKKLFSLYKKGNFFKLRERLQKVQNAEEAQMRFLGAVTYNAFNKPVKSNRVIDRVLGSNSSLADSLTGDLRSLMMANDLRLNNYSKALEAAKAIIKAPDSQTDSAEVANAKNMSKLFKALADVSPQKISIQKTTLLPLTRDKANLQRIPVQVGKSNHHFVLDTGAGFSTIKHSVAKEAGLKIIHVGLKVKSGTGGKVRADIAVANQVTFGHVQYKNVVFLVFPDKALSFPKINYKIPGIIGFPVIEAAGEVQYIGGNTLKIPANPPNRSVHNLALKGLSPRVLASVEVSSSNGKTLGLDSLVCTLDTGAKNTAFLAPFYHQYRKQVKKLVRRDTIHIGGAGKASVMPVYRLPKVKFSIGGKHVPLKNVVVYTEPTFESTQSGLGCNIGQDLLSQFDKIIMNFNSMSLVLR